MHLQIKWNSQQFFFGNRYINVEWTAKSYPGGPVMCILNTIKFMGHKSIPIQNKLTQDVSIWIYNSYKLGIEGLNLSISLSKFSRNLHKARTSILSITASPPSLQEKPWFKTLHFHKPQSPICYVLASKLNIININFSSIIQEHKHNQKLNRRTTP